MAGDLLDERGGEVAPALARLQLREAGIPVSHYPYVGADNRLDVAAMLATPWPNHSPQPSTLANFSTKRRAARQSLKRGSMPSPDSHTDMPFVIAHFGAGMLGGEAGEEGIGRHAGGLGDDAHRDEHGLAAEGQPRHAAIGMERPEGPSVRNQHNTTSGPAVISSVAPARSALASTRPRHASTVSTAFTAAGSTPECPTMSPLA